MMGEGQRNLVWVRAACSAARGVSAIAVVFCLVMAGLILTTHLQTTQIDPLNDASLVRLREQFTTDSGNESLKQSIRGMDLLARRAFFTSQHQLISGALLLLIGAVVAVTAGKMAAELNRALPDPMALPPVDAWLNDLGFSRRGVALCGAALVATALTLAFTTRTELTDEFAIPSRPAVAAPVTDTPSTPESVPEPPLDLPGREEIMANWPSFRGPDGNGIAYVRTVPEKWDTESGLGVLWKTAVPRQGFSSPIVWADMAFLTGGDQEAQELYGFSMKTGELLWRHELGQIQGSAPDAPEVNDNTGWAAPTPATDGRRVAAIFADGKVVCCTTDGTRLWARALGVPENHYAHSSSLLIDEERLYVQLDDSENPRLLALDVASGKELWAVSRGDISWASPVLITMDGTRQLLLADSSTVTAYAPKTGALLWEEACLGGEVAPSPSFADGMVVVANDGASASGVRLTMDEGKWSTEIEWEYDDVLPDTASPLIAGGYVFLPSSGGTMICLDAATGDVAWEQEFDDGFYASPVLACGLVYAIDLGGIIHIFKPGPEYESSGDPAVGEGVSSTPAFVDGRIVIRTDSALICVGDAPSPDVVGE